MEQQDRQMFLNELDGLIKKHQVSSFFFYGVDHAGQFGDYDISPDDTVTMVLAIMSHEYFTDAAKRIGDIWTRGLAKQLKKMEGLEQDDFKWTWRKK